MNEKRLIHPIYTSIWTIQHIRNGKVIWSDVGKNSLVQQGEEQILETYFRAGVSFTPTQFYVRLCNETLLITSTLTSISTEPSGFGYAPQLLERSTVGFPTKELIGGVQRLTSKVISFTAVGGQIGPVNVAYLSTTSDNTGALIAFRTLSMARTILSADTMTLQFRVQLS